jgi:hypothetical protein
MCNMSYITPGRQASWTALSYFGKLYGIERR